MLHGPGWSYSSCFLFVLSLIFLNIGVTALHVDDKAVVSMLSELLLRDTHSDINSSGDRKRDVRINRVKLEIELSFNEGSPPAVVSSKTVEDVGRKSKAVSDRKKRSVQAPGHGSDLELALLIPTECIVVVKLGIPVNTLNQTAVSNLRFAFASTLDLPVDNVNIDKIRYHGNDVEMFFVKAYSDPLVFSLDDLMLAVDVVQPENVKAIKQLIPYLNITAMYSQHSMVFTSYPEPFWMQTAFRYVAGAVGAVVFMLTVALVYCCCKKREKTLKETDDEIRGSQKIFYPTVKPDTKNPLMIQPGNEPVFIPTGSVTLLSSQPVRKFKAKGLLERRGSSASLTIDLNPSPELSRWEGGTPPKESTGLEFLLSAGNRLSRRDLRNAIKHPRSLHEEFWEIPMNHPEKVFVAGSGMKNRYRTIIPNEHSCVVLPDSEWDPLSSYINANYIRGYEGEPHTYIATQGPLPHTIVDFWHMVWHDKSPIVVMITKLKEKDKSKCEHYLPEDYSSSIFGEIEVRVVKKYSRNGYSVRNLVLKCSGESHTVIHYWYTAWPDHKPPDSPNMLLELVKEVDLRRYSDNSLRVRGPVIVHCSAGIGRTGCFIAISIGMKQIREEHSVDVLGIVCSMRIDRGGMIQTHEQYHFIHQALCQYEKELAAEPPGAFVPD